MISRRTSAEVVAGLRRVASSLRPATPPRIDPTPFERLAKMPAVRGNALLPLIDGQASFDAIFATIDAAERHVLVQFFIVRDDRIGRAFHDRLGSLPGVVIMEADAASNLRFILRDRHDRPPGPPTC